MILAVATAAKQGPLHMHISEQPGEVAEVEAALGRRPVEWLLDSAAPDARWCLIHATHMRPAEMEGLAASGATVGLCPVTEANLGDGAFDAPRFLKAGGSFGVGTDSNIRISAHQELRTLEYSQRQRDIARNVLAVKEGSTGRSFMPARFRAAQRLWRGILGRLKRGASPIWSPSTASTLRFARCSRSS